MYSTFDTGEAPANTGLKRLARRDLPTTPRVPRPAAVKPAEVARATYVWPEITVGASLKWVRAGLVWIAVLALAGAACGFAYATLATPKFTASTDLVVAPANLQVVTNDLYPTVTDQNARLLDVESKLRVITSGNVLRRVVDQLGLASDPEFVHTGGLELPFIGGGTSAPADATQTAVDALDKKVSASREERSYVVTLSVSTEDAQKSVRIADAVVAAFQAELARADAEGASRVAQSLTDRLSELRAGVTAAEAAVATFRRDHGLEQTNGELVNSQAMTQLNQRLVDAQQGLIGAQSHYAEMTDPVTGGANADAVQTPTMVALRTQYGLLKQQADAAATMFGPLHPTRVSAERQLTGLVQQISAEAKRAVQAAKLDVDQATRTVTELTSQTQSARTTVADDGEAQVALNELDRDAKAKSDVYEAFLARAREMTERQQIDTTDIRVITPATPPSARSWPPRGVVVGGLGGFGGVGFGIVLVLGLGFLREARRPRKAN